MLIPPLWFTVTLLSIGWAWAAVVVHGPWLLLYPAAWLMVGLVMFLLSKLTDAVGSTTQAPRQPAADPVAPASSESTSSV